MGQRKYLFLKEREMSRVFPMTGTVLISVQALHVIMLVHNIFKKWWISTSLGRNPSMLMKQRLF